VQGGSGVGGDSGHLMVLAGDQLGQYEQGMIRIGGNLDLKGAISGSVVSSADSLPSHLILFMLLINSFGRISGV